MTVTAQRTNLAAVRNGDTPVLTIETTTTPVTQTIALSDIQTTGDTQMRASLNPDTLSEYMETLDVSFAKWPFPPVVVFYDGNAYHLADGFHRVAAARQKGRWPVIPADVRIGTRRDAVLHAAGANASHGLRRTNADKRRAVETLLRDEEWGQWSNMEIARRCAVSEYMVREIRGVLERSSSILSKIGSTRTVQRGERTYTQDTARIGLARNGEASFPTSEAVDARASDGDFASRITVNGDRPLPDWVTNTGNVVASAATGSRQQGAQLGKCRVCSRPLYDPAQAAQGIGACCAAKLAAGGLGSGDADATEDEPAPESAATTPLAVRSRLGELMVWLAGFNLALSHLEPWAVATGHFTATLEAERGLRHLIELTDHELQGLGAK